VEEAKSSGSSERLAKVVYDLARAVGDVLESHHVTVAEYRQGLRFLAEAGRSAYAHDLPLLLGLFLNSRVDEWNHPSAHVTPSSTEGPIYVAGALRLTPPYVLPMRNDEPGTPLFLSGRVTSLDGSPVPGAELDIWQVNGIGEYSQGGDVHLDDDVTWLNDEVPDYNLRGVIRTDDDGRYEVLTVAPIPYDAIPLSSVTHRFVDMLGRDCFRPAHIHVKITDPGHRPLTTQLFFDDDPYLEADIVMAYKPSLTIRRRYVDDEKEIAARGLSRPFSTGTYDFVLMPA
jgi:catechol 1,2-dioxygenase